MRCRDGSVRMSMIESERSPSWPGWFAWSEPSMRMFVGVESISDIDSKLHRAAGDAMLECRPFQKLHGNERFSVLFTNVVNRADVRREIG